MKHLISLLCLVFLSLGAHANGIDIKKVRIVKAGCDAASYIDQFDGLTDIDGSPVNVGRCYNRATRFLITMPNIENSVLINEMCKVAIFDWPGIDWQERCKVAAMTEAMK